MNAAHWRRRAAEMQKLAGDMQKVIADKTLAPGVRYRAAVIMDHAVDAAREFERLEASEGNTKNDRPHH